MTPKDRLTKLLLANSLEMTRIITNYVRSGRIAKSVLHMQYAKKVDLFLVKEDLLKKVTNV